MDINKADWNTLSEPYHFFESYKDYLEIDITAENEDDLRKWKGWVESRLRHLTLKVVIACVFLHFLLFTQQFYQVASAFVNSFDFLTCLGCK